VKKMRKNEKIEKNQNNQKKGEKTAALRLVDEKGLICTHPACTHPSIPDTHPKEDKNQYEILKKVWQFPFTTVARSLYLSLR